MSQFLSPRRCRGVPLLLILTITALLSACSKEEVKQAFDSAAAKTQELAAPVVDKIEQALPESGSVALQMTPPAEIKSAGIEVIAVGDGRPNVVQVLTYQPGDSTSYPRMMLHGTTASAGPIDLAGQELKLEMYLQMSSSAPIAITQPESPATVSFERHDAENNAIHASLSPVELMGADGKKVTVMGGNIVAVIRTGEK